MALAQAIFTGDDFGRTSSINAAIIRGHREGVLTSASLMVTGEASPEAVKVAREHPTLAVGLHLLCTDGRAALSASEIPHIVTSTGHFPQSPAKAGLQYFLSPTAREELARELAAQFELFAQTSLILSHVDGHHHMHVHPSIFPLVLPLAERYGAKGVRLPRDDLRLGLKLDRSRLLTKFAWSAIYACLCRRCLHRMRTSYLAVADRVYGLHQTGNMHEEYVLGILAQAQMDRVELYFHPDTREHLGKVYGANPRDLATLLSPRVRAILEARGVKLATYPALQRWSG